MEIHELDNTIKRALLHKTNEIQPAENTFQQILVGLEKRQACNTLSTRSKRYIMAMICAVFVVFGTAFILLPVNAPAPKVVNVLGSQRAAAKNPGEVFKHALNADSGLGSVNTLTRVNVNTFLFETFAGYLLLNRTDDLELYLRLFVMGRMTLVRTWYEDRFGHGQVLAH